MVNALLLAALAVPAAGCQSLSSTVPASPDLGANTSDALPARAQPAGPAVVVQLYPEGRKPTETLLPLSDGMTVHQALVQAHAARAFRKMKIEVIRPVDRNGRFVKMGVKYLPSKRHVAANTDYALRPGDRIVVTEQLAAPLDQLLGPLAKTLSR